MPRGRPLGAKGKNTEIKRQQLMTALEVCRAGNISPPQMVRDNYLIMRALAVLPIAGASSEEEQNRMLAELPDVQKEAVFDRLYRTSEILLKLMEYGFPKLARIEHTGAGGGPIEHSHAGAIEYLEGRISSLAERVGSEEDSSRSH